MHFWIIFVIIITLDQITKLLVQAFMNAGDSVAVLGDFLALSYILNPGAAFGFFAYQTNMFIIITVLVVVFIVFVNYKLPDYFFMMRTGLAFQLGGAVGNLVDRIRIGYVIDFIDFSIFPPIFNIADVAIVIGIFYFAVSLWGEGRQPVAAKKYLPAAYKKTNLRFRPFGYDYKEIEDYLMLIAGDIELFNLGREKIEEQLSKLRQELKEVREDHFDKKDQLQKAIDNIRDLKEKYYEDIKNIKVEEEERRLSYSEKTDAVRKEKIELSAEKKQLLLNRNKYESAVRITKNLLSTIYSLANTLPENAAKELEKQQKSADSIREKALQEKNDVEIEYNSFFEENRLLKEEFRRKKEIVEQNQKREESLKKALFISETAAQKIIDEARLEAELIKQEAEKEARRLMEEAQYQVDKIESETPEDDSKMQEQISDEKEAFKDEISGILKSFEEDRFIKDSGA